MKLRGQDNLENGIEYIVLLNDIYDYLSAIICDKDDLSGGVVAPHLRIIGSPSPGWDILSLSG